MQINIFIVVFFYGIVLEVMVTFYFLPSIIRAVFTRRLSRLENTDLMGPHHIKINKYKIYHIYTICYILIYTINIYLKYIKTILLQIINV